MIIVKIAESVVFSGRVPIILTWYVPGGLDFDTKIVPFFWSTLMRSLAWLRVFPVELSYPVYVQVLAWGLQLRFAENGVIARYLSGRPHDREKVEVD
jgi:hypothetical protein